MLGARVIPAGHGHPADLDELSTPHTPPMRVLIVAAGSMGDVAPYTGLAARLLGVGHDVAIATYACFADLVTNCGARFRPLPGDPRTQQNSAENQRWQRGGGGALNGFRLVRLVAAHTREMNGAVLAAARAGVDVLLLSTPALFSGYPVADGLGIPSIGVFLTPMHPTGEFPPAIGLPSLGRWGNRAVHGLLRDVGFIPFARATRQLRAELGLPPLSAAGMFREQDRRRWPVCYGFSPSVLARPGDWRDGLDVTGYFWPLRREGWQPPPELTRFLESGPAPVFVGFGSLATGDSDRLSHIVRSALREVGARGVIQAGWADLDVSDDNVITIGEAPHDWLFPRMAATVHHCGAGTTAAGLAAGVPAVAVPLAGDQPFWAKRLFELGATPAVLPHRKLTVDALAARIRAVLADPCYAACAAELSGRIGEEDGAGKVIAALDRLVG
ncbi:MAG: glycosyltransferase [Sciscionella sp.]